MTKVELIQQKINNDAVLSEVSKVSAHEPINEVPTPLLTAFENLADNDVKSLIQHSALKYCSLDPMPSQLVSKCQSLFPITTIISKSLQNGSFPKCWKEAFVYPLLKKSGMDIFIQEF